MSADPKYIPTQTPTNKFKNNCHFYCISWLNTTASRYRTFVGLLSPADVKQLSMLRAIWLHMKP